MGGKDEKEKVQKKRLLKKPEKTRKPTTRQRKLVKGLISGKSQFAAAREAGYAETSALHVDKIINKPVVQALFVELMDKAGITDEKLARRLSEGIDAKETKFFQKDGLVTDSRDVIAHSERRAHLEIALKIKGHLKDKVEVSADQKLGDMLAGIWDGEEAK